MSVRVVRAAPVLAGVQVTRSDVSVRVARPAPSPASVRVSRNGPPGKQGEQGPPGLPGDEVPDGQDPVLLFENALQ